MLDVDALGEGRLRFVVWVRGLRGVLSGGGLGAGSRVPFVGVVIYILRVEDGASGTLPHLGQTGIVMVGEPSASGTDDEGEDTERDEECADNRPDHSPSDAARGKRASSWNKHGPSERPRSQSCCGALLQLVHESKAHRALCVIEKTKFLES